MGTNYYATIDQKPPCPTHRLHIGKSSGGWCFSLHAIPDRGLTSWAAWDALLHRPDVSIVDEYGDAVHPDEMRRIVTERSWPRTPENEWSDTDYRQNSAVPGPNGLVRHAVGAYCLAHGEGTWDLIPGDFS